MIAEHGRPSLLPVVVGFFLLGAIVLAAGWWASRTGAPTSAPPQLRLLSPTADTTLSGPLTLRFTTSRPLRLQPTGWGIGRFHLHALVGTRELMPSAADIRPVGELTYNWTVPPHRNTAEVRLVWSLPSHQALRHGASQLIRVTWQ